MTDQGMTACQRFGHAWYARQFGGVDCGRCGAYSSQFCMVDGKPSVVNQIREQDGMSGEQEFIAAQAWDEGRKSAFEDIHGATGFDDRENPYDSRLYLKLGARPSLSEDLRRAHEALAATYEPGLTRQPTIERPATQNEIADACTYKEDQS